MRSVLYNNTLVRSVFASAARTTGTSNSTAVDTAVFGNYFKSALFIITTGVITDGTHAITIEESADNSNWTAVPADRIQGTLPSIVAADDNAFFVFGCIPNARYVRLVSTISAGATGGLYSAVAVLAEGSVNAVARA